MAKHVDDLIASILIKKASKIKPPKWYHASNFRPRDSQYDTLIRVVEPKSLDAIKRTAKKYAAATVRGFLKLRTFLGGRP